jgi:hypothetical protein
MLSRTVCGTDSLGFCVSSAGLTLCIWSSPIPLSWDVRLLAFLVSSGVAGVNGVLGVRAPNAIASVRLGDPGAEGRSQGGIGKFRSENSLPEPEDLYLGSLEPPLSWVTVRSEGRTGDAGDDGKGETGDGDRLIRRSLAMLASSTCCCRRISSIFALSKSVS